MPRSKDKGAGATGRSESNGPAAEKPGAATADEMFQDARDNDDAGAAAASDGANAYSFSGVDLRKDNPFSMLRTPYEDGCAFSILSAKLTDSQLPAALNFLLVWLVREALYRDCSNQQKGFFSIAISDTYAAEEDNFNDILLNDTFNELNVAVKKLFVDSLSKHERKNINIAAAKQAWLLIANSLPSILLKHKVSPKATACLVNVFFHAFDLFENPEKNLLSINIKGLEGIQPEEAISNPLYAAKLNIIYYILSLQLHNLPDQLVQKQSFTIPLAEKLNAIAITDSLAKEPRETLRSIAVGMIEEAVALRSELNSMLSSLFKPAVGVNANGNFGVMIARLKAGFEQMQQRFGLSAAEASPAHTA